MGLGSATDSYLAVPSRAALLQQIRARIPRSVVWPNVKDKMRDVPKFGGRAVIHLDLVRSIESGSIIDAHENPASSWIVTVIGMDTIGEPLGVTVKYCACEAEPLEFMEFFFLPS